MSRLAPIALGLLALLATLWFLMPEDSGPPPAPASLPAAPAEAVREELPDPASEVAAAADATTTDASLARSASEPAADDGSRPETLLTGRCIDEQGNPLADVRCMLRESRDRNEVQAWELEHGALEWERPGEFRSDADGRFALRFWAPEPLRWNLTLYLEGVVPLSARWDTLEPGTLDLGNVILRSGIVVRGRVLDTNGSPPLESLRIQISDDASRRAETRGTLYPRRGTSLAVGEDGRFEARGPLLPGRYRIRLPQGHRFASAQREEHVDLAVGMEPLELRIEPTDASATIRGIVVDEAGKPRGGVQIQTGQFQSSTMSARDGSFTLRRSEREQSFGSFPLSLSGRHLDRTITEETFSWGDEGIRLTVRRGVDVEITVLREGSLEPVERYAAYLEQAQSGYYQVRTSQFSGTEPQGGWQHPDGKLLIEGIPRSTYRLRIEAHSSTDLGSTDVQEIEVSGDQTVRTQVVLAPAVEQVVRVVDADGNPVAAAEVQLLWSPTGEPIDERSQILGPNAYSSGAFARIDKQATADAAGEARLRGSPRRSFGLRVEAAEHAPIFRWPFVLSESPAEVRLAAGARVRVQVEPLAYLQALRDAAVAEYGERFLEQPHGNPSVHLERVEGNRRITVPANQFEPSVFDEAGFAEIQGVPPGTWDLVFQGGGGRGRVTLEEAVVLRPGETREFHVDKGAELPQPFRARVLLDGVPYQGQVLVVSLLPQPSGRGGGPRQVPRKVEADGEGVFEVSVPAAEQTLVLTTRGSDGRNARIPSTNSIDSRIESATLPTFEVRTGTLTLRLVDPAGKPVAGAVLHWSGRTHKGFASATGTTGNDGRFTLRCAPGSFQSNLRIRSLMSDEAYGRYIDEKKAQGVEWAEAAEGTNIPIGPIELLPGVATDELVIELPPEWDR